MLSVEDLVPESVHHLDVGFAVTEVIGELFVDGSRFLGVGVGGDYLVFGHGRPPVEGWVAGAMGGII